MTLSADVSNALALLGGGNDDRVVDLLVDPGAGGRALDATPEHGGLVLRAAPDPGATSPSPGYGPVPLPPLWLRVVRGAREVGTVGLRGGDGMVRRADHVALEEHAERCCDAPGCDRARTRASVVVVLASVAEPGAPDRLLVAEQRVLGPDDDRPGPTVTLALAARLAGVLGVPLHRAGAEVGDEEHAAAQALALPSPLGEALSAADLARFALRSEGARTVVRDWDSRGPRASAGRNAIVGGALMLVAAAAWYALVRSLGEGGASSTSIAAGIAGALFTLAGYAFLGVARFSAKYRASSLPVVVVERDRIVVAPWVGRDGAVDTRLEGHLGAAISLGEVRTASPKPRDGSTAVELDTDHGPIDAMLCPSAAAARLWSAALSRVIDEARHPRKEATARQRARQRAA